MSIYVRDAGGNRQKIAGVGLPGPAGKSAYQYAMEGGFSGTEEEFRAVVGIRNNDNLLDNWYLADPINQRGQTEYIGFVYTIDRWVTEGATIKVGDDGLQLENPSEGAVQFVTNFEASRLIDNQVYTAAILAKNLVGSGIMIIQHRAGMYTYLAANALSEGLTATSGQISTSGIPLLGITIRLEPHSSVKLIAAKLELGPVQTLAHKDASGNWVLNDPPPNKALELAKCQRYFQRLNIIRPKEVGIQWLFADFKTTMHINPTIVNIISDPPNAEITYTASKDSVRFKSDTISYFEVMSFDANADL